MWADGKTIRQRELVLHKGRETVPSLDSMLSLLELSLKIIIIIIVNSVGSIKGLRLMAMMEPAALP